MATPATTFAAVKTLHTVDDLVPRAQAILAALDAGDTRGAEQGLTKMQEFLRQVPAQTLADNEQAVLSALLLFPNHRGQRVASYLVVHCTDPEQRWFWQAAEHYLNPRMFSMPQREPAHA